MAGYISKQVKNNKTYYYFQIGYRVPSKKRGEKTKVKTNQQYLGSAEQILNAHGYQVNNDKEIVPLEAKEQKVYEMQSVGLITALFDISESLGLRELLHKYFSGKVSGIKVSDYLLIGAFHRIADPDPKTKIIDWAKKTNIGELFKIDIMNLDSQNFWKAYDQVLSEKEVQERWKKVERIKNKEKRAKAELGYLCEKSIDEFQKALGQRIITAEKITLDEILSDTTNFYTYIDKHNTRNHIAECGNNKKKQHGKRQVSLAMTISGSYGLPLFHQIYKGNYNDVTLFPEYLGKLMNHCEYFASHVEQIRHVVDKGNNSQNNMDYFQKRKKDYPFPFHWVGSLRLDYFQHLRRKNLEKLDKEKGEYKYYTEETLVFGKKHTTVLTYHEKTAVRQEKTLQRNIKKYKGKVLEYWNKLKPETKTKWNKDIRFVKLEAKIPYKQYKGLFKYSWNNKEELKITLTKSKLTQIRQGFGKQLLFSTDSLMKPEKIIDYYHDNWKMNQDHRILKMPDTISFHPMWVWTDSKIRIQSMINILGLLLCRLLVKRLAESPDNEGISLSQRVVKTVLMEIKRVIELKHIGKIKVGFTNTSHIHKILCKVFHLDKWVEGVGEHLME